MKAFVFHPSNRFTSWSMGGGLPDTLARMGLDVIGVQTPTAGAGGAIEVPEAVFKGVVARLPKIEHLQNADVILVSGPEHLGPWLDAVYEKQAWAELKAKKLAWLHENVDRPEYQINLDALDWMAEHFFFPAHQDAERYSQDVFLGSRAHWMPFGVDTEVFRPEADDQEKIFEAIFIGTMYQMRQRYCEELAKFDTPDILFGGASVESIEGYMARASAGIMAHDIRRAKVFFNLPAMSKLVVSKVYEVMACGTLLFTPMLSHGQGIEQNMLKQFDVHKDLVYYRAANCAGTGRLLKEWLSKEKTEEREARAKRGCEVVHAKHSLTLRLSEMLNKAGVVEFQPQ